MGIEMSLGFIIFHTVIIVSGLMLAMAYQTSQNQGMSAIFVVVVVINAVSLVLHLITFEGKVEDRVIERVEQIMCHNDGGRLMFTREGEFECVKENVDVE
jgi:hypothetical protein